MSQSIPHDDHMRWRIHVQGIVQGVGFRPFIYGLALRLKLTGWVRNDPAGVTIELQGLPNILDQFLRLLRSEAPPLARIDSITHELIQPISESDFVIAASSVTGRHEAQISPDSATCADCLAELFDPHDRRYRYPFINCTNCGPRFTIVADIPYDRPYTSMHMFPMCADCQAEYDDPLNRRFHAQPNACPVCGPQLFFYFATKTPRLQDQKYRQLLFTTKARRHEDRKRRQLPFTTKTQRLEDRKWRWRLFATKTPRLKDTKKVTQQPSGLYPPSHDEKRLNIQHSTCSQGNPAGSGHGHELQISQSLPTSNNSTFNIQHSTLLFRAAQALHNGAIVAIKGLGGYHLACDATNAEAVNRLRQRKQREAKPFAVLVADLAAAKELCWVSNDEEALLLSSRRPIVLLEQRPETALVPDLAPGYSTLGIMLPYLPLQHVLIRDFAALHESAGRSGPAMLVMTSGNSSDEPIAYRDHDALERLDGIADAFLFHNREILTRCDDTVMRIVAGGQQLLRRSRGYAPEPIRLANPSPLPILACGAHLKNTFCLLRERTAVVSHHIGDLENLETLSAFREGIAHLSRLFSIEPEAVAYDLHPEYLATKEALSMPIMHRIGVQHHHAHIASVLAEHGLKGPVIGIAADGTGYGDDGTIWGGEILLADCYGYERVGHLLPVALPGADAAAREPWRMAASYLHMSYGPDFLNLDIPFTKKLDQQRWQILSHMIERRINSPLTSSMGRLFDAIAALIGLRDTVIYEGQAAIELEQSAALDMASYPYTILGNRPFQLDLRPTIQAIVVDIRQQVSIAQISGRFHTTIVMILAQACQKLRSESGLNQVALSGGVFQNKRLIEQLTEQLEHDHFQVFSNRLVPPNDGGISLGQAAVAAARVRRRE